MISFFARWQPNKVSNEQYISVRAQIKKEWQKLILDNLARRKLDIFLHGQLN